METNEPVALAPEQSSTALQTQRMLMVLVLVNILNYVDRRLPCILGESIKRDLQLSDTQLGLLTGLAFALCYSLAALPLARLADRWSAKRILTLSIAFWSLMTTLGGLARGFVQLSVTRTGVALGEAGSTPASHALISRSFAADLAARRWRYFQWARRSARCLGWASAAGWRMRRAGPARWSAQVSPGLASRW